MGKNVNSDSATQKLICRITVSYLIYLLIDVFPLTPLLVGGACYSDSNYHSGSQLELHAHSRLLVVNI